MASSWPQFAQSMNSTAGRSVPLKKCEVSPASPASFHNSPMADKAPMHVVTGAFGFIGQRIAERLVAREEPVRTLTDHPRQPDPFNGRVSVRPYDFGNPAKLQQSLAGASVLYNTYWVRFE